MAGTPGYMAPGSPLTDGTYTQKHVDGEHLTANHRQLASLGNPGTGRYLC